MKIKDMVPFNPMEIDPFASFNRFMRGFSQGIDYPNIDIINEKDKIILVADMPGVDKKDVKIKIKENSVVLSAHVSNELKDEGKNYYREERTYEDYYREVPLPVPVKKEGSKATLKNGTLRLELKKNDAENGDSDVKIE